MLCSWYFTNHSCKKMYTFNVKASMYSSIIILYQNIQKYIFLHGGCSPFLEMSVRALYTLQDIAQWTIFGRKDGTNSRLKKWPGILTCPFVFVDPTMVQNITRQFYFLICDWLCTLEPIFISEWFSVLERESQEIIFCLFCIIKKCLVPCLMAMIEVLQDTIFLSKFQSIWKWSMAFRSFKHAIACTILHTFTD